MPVTTNFSGMTNTTIVQFDNSVKGLTVSTIEQGNIDKIISAKKDITPTDTSTGKLIDNINMYEVGDFKIEHDAILTPVETIYGDQLVSAIKDVSTVITIHQNVSDTAADWSKEKSKTDHYVEFPLNGRPATWLDLIKYQSWYILGFGHEVVGNSYADINNELHSLWNSASSYTVTRIGYYYYDSVDGLCMGFTDMDPFENITMNKYYELWNIMKDEADYNITDADLDCDYINFVFEACFNGITDPELEHLEGVPHLGGVISVKVENYKAHDYAREEPDSEIPLYAFQFSKQQLSLDSSSLGFNYYKPADSTQISNIQLTDTFQDYIYQIDFDTLTSYDYVNNTRRTLISSPSLYYSNTCTVDYKKINQTNKLYIDARKTTYAKQVGSSPFTGSRYVDKANYTLCIFPDPYNSNTYKIIPTDNTNDLISIVQDPIYYRYNITYSDISYTLSIDSYEYNSQYTNLRQTITQYPVLFGGCIEFNKNVTYDGKTNTLASYYEDFILLTIIPQSIRDIVVPRPSANLNGGDASANYGYNQRDWVIPERYLAPSTRHIMFVPDSAITVDPDGTMIYRQPLYNISYLNSSVFAAEPNYTTTKIYLFGKINYARLQMSNAGVTIKLQNIMLKEYTRECQTIQTINLFFKDFLPATTLPGPLSNFNLKTTLCGNTAGNYFYIPYLWKEWTNKNYDPTYHVPLVIEKTVKMNVYGVTCNVTVVVYYWYVG